MKNNNNNSRAPPQSRWTSNGLETTTWCKLTRECNLHEMHTSTHGLYQGLSLRLAVQGKNLVEFFFTRCAGLEILSPEGLRLDGRRPHELRKIICRMGVFKQADGSAYIEMGNTKALATVYGPHEVTNKAKILHDRVFVNCQFSMATFSTGERKKRPKGDRKSTQTTMLIGRTFEAAILTQLYPWSQIDIYVQVILAFLCCIFLGPRRRCLLVTQRLGDELKTAVCETNAHVIGLPLGWDPGQPGGLWNWWSKTENFLQLLVNLTRQFSRVRWWSMLSTS